MHRWLNTLLLIVGWWVGLACGLDNTDDRMLRRYAVCLTDANTALYRMTTSSASGSVTLSAEAMEKRLRGQLERGGVHHGEDQGVKGGEKTCHWGGVKLYHLGGA